MNILIVTSEWPRFEGDISGIHVFNQVNHLKQMGIMVDVFPFSGQKNPLTYWHISHAFKKMDIEKYDIVHAHHGQSGIVALAQNKVPVVMTFHGSDLQGLFNKKGNITFLGYVLRFVSRMVAKAANEVIIVSDHLKTFVPVKKYHVIPIGIDLQLFSPMTKDDARHKLGFPPRGCLVLFVGNPARTEKRYWLADTVVEKLKTKMEVELIVANGIPNEVMPLYMNACDALLITSISEGSPTMVKEALACNLPMVSTDVGDIRRRIGHVSGCVVCDDDKVETLSSALYQVLQRKERIDGRSAVADLDEVRLTERVIEVYYAAIGKSKGENASSLYL